LQAKEKIMNVLFTRNTLPAGRPVKSPPGANDIHIVWAGGRGGWIEIAILTIDGKPAGAVWPPRGANDVDIAWTTDEDGEISFAGYWTRDGEPMAPIPIPPQINDFHFMFIPLPGGTAPLIKKAWWTKDRKPVAPIPVPKGANDFHLW
jgi:hypothetical protein